MKETVHSLLAQSLERHAGSEAVVTPGKRSLSYAELGRQLDHDHAFLRSAGFGARSRIGVAMPPGAEGLLMMAAVARSTACAHFDPELDVDSFVRLMTAMRLDAVIVPDGPASNAARAASRIGIALIGAATAAGGAAGEHELRADTGRSPAPADLPGADDLAFLWHTSGTTGAPKIIAYEQWRICFDVRKRVARRRIDAADRCLITSTPASAVTSRLCLSNLATGATLMHTGDLAAESVLSAIESLAPTYFMAAPALLSRLLELIEKRDKTPDHRLRAIYSSFAEQSPQARARLEQALGVPMVISYGMTEMGGIAESPIPPETAPTGSVGRPVLDLAIVDDAGRFLARGQQGEVWVRGPEVITAYENPPEANRDAFRDGWFRTGDCGLLDQQGFLHLTGRLKDAINRGGVKIAPTEVELALAGHPAVREAAAFARQHPTLGEDLCAVVVLEDGRSASEAELRRFVRQRLAASKVPTRIVAATSLPRNAAGKLPRAELAAFGEALLRQAWQPPAGPHEQKLAEIYRQVLRLDDIGRDDRFFDRGGDSLRAVEAIELIEGAFGVALTMDTLLENPSLAALARLIAEQRAGQTDMQST
ncbi:MAG: non-ribosomal peptide synthetase [Burkholderiales bacterium]|nr:non-ribosomal peptide synthetase [Burkholderiales bacterium]